MGERSRRGQIRARRCAVQALYQWQLSGQDPQDILKEFIAEREIADVDLECFEALMRGVPREIVVLLDDLGELIDRDWRQVDPVERSVLLIGAYELRFCPHVPWRVVIDQSVELCKMFGAQDGYRYINGVLDKLARKLRDVEIAGAAGSGS